jgi:hypothetical protein
MVQGADRVAAVFTDPTRVLALTDTYNSRAQITAPALCV